MAKVSQDKLRKTDKIVLKSKKNSDILSVVFPNGIQVGLNQENFNKGVKLPNLSSAPTDTTNVLYAVDGTIFFNGVLVGGITTAGNPDGENEIVAAQMFS